MHALDDVRAAVSFSRSRFEVADIFRIHGQHYRNEHRLTPGQHKAMRDIQACRTAALGGHVDVCEHGCGYYRISYNSCRNRHCPKCQGLKSAKWLAQRQDKILPTHYFHMVFTLPHEMHPIILQNPEVGYNLLFRAASQSLLELAGQWKRLRAEVGFTAVLHTWNQDLLFHPHLHVVVTGGGLNESQTKWISTRNGFLVPVRALSKKFQGKFLDLLNTAFAENKLSLQGSIRNLHDPLAFERLMKNLYRKKWVVYSKQPFGGPDKVFAYLGLYSHRVAISNHRLVELAHGKVTFLARDNQHPGAKRRVCVAVEEFIRRFLLHILPKGFVKIRHYGLMAPSNVNSKLETARSLLVQESAHPSKINSPCEDNSDPDQRTTETDPTTCPACQGKLIRRPLTILDQFLPAGMQGPTFFDSS